MSVTRTPVAATASGGVGSRLGRAVDAAPQVTAIVIAAVVWEVAARLAQQTFFPPLSGVLGRLAELVADGEILPPLSTSIGNLLLGFGISAVAGVVIGIAMGVNWRIDAALDIYVNALLTAPSLVFAPVFFSVFGLSRAAIVGLVIMYTVFIVIVTAKDAVRAVPSHLVEMSRCYGARPWQVYRKIVLPAALPLIFAGLRVGAGRAVKGMVNGEMFIAVVGLGALIMRAGRNFDAESVLAVLIVVLAVSSVLVRLLQLADRRLNAWLPDTARS